MTDMKPIKTPAPKTMVKAVPLKVAKPAAKPIPAAIAAMPAPVEAPVAPATPVATAIAAAPAAIVEPIAPPAPKPVAVEASPATASVALAPAVPEAAPVKGPKTMNDTFNTAAETAKTTMNDTVSNVTERATFMFNDMNGRAKDAMAKGTKAVEELVEFSKGNLEALVASGRVAAKGAEEIAKYSAEYGRSTIEKANATARQFASVKSPTEFFQLQGDVAKQTLDALVAEGSKFTESYLKLLGEVSQPISNRVAIATDKVKSTVAA